MHVELDLLQSPEILAPFILFTAKGSQRRGSNAGEPVAQRAVRRALDGMIDTIPLAEVPN
ncbi:MAG: hypothetical protein ACREHD_22195 [Pirellulales bacterium]